MKKLLLTLFTTIFLVSPVPVLAATLKLNPATGTANVGCPFVVNIELDTGTAQTDGTDAILKFDATKLTATGITSGTIYPDYPGNDYTSTPGRITVSGLASVSQAFTGKGILATVTFTVASGATSGSSAVTFDFDPNTPQKTTDSNVVQRDTIQDVLSSVGNGSYTVGTGSCSQQTLTTTAPALSSGGSASSGTSIGVGNQGATGVGQKTPVGSLPQGGTETFTAMIAIMGAALSILGVLGFLVL